MNESNELARIAQDRFNAAAVEVDLASAQLQRESAQAAAEKVETSSNRDIDIDELMMMCLGTTSSGSSMVSAANSAVVASSSLQPPPSTSSPLLPAHSRAVPEAFECSITLDIMEDPVLCVADGFTYERRAIESWFASGNRTSPRTNMEIDTLQLVPNRLVKERIDTWRQESKKN